MAKKAKRGAARVAQPPGDGIQSLSGDDVAATPAITSPLAGYVLPATDLMVTITTNRTDLKYVLTLTDVTMGGTPVTLNIPVPGTSPFTVKIDGANLVADRQYKIEIEVDPSEPQPPYHQSDAVGVNTEEPLALFTMVAPKKAAAKRKK